MRKGISVILIVLALCLLFADWLSYVSIKTSLTEMLDETKSDIAGFWDVEEFPQDKADKLIHQLEIGASPYEISEFVGFYGRLFYGIPERTDELNIAAGMFFGIQGLFWLLVLLMIKLIIQHIFGRRPRGMGALVLLLIWFLPLSFFAITVNSQMGTNEIAINGAAIVAVVAMAGSCIVWDLQLRAEGAQRGKWSLTPKVKCSFCGAMQDGNSFVCDRCNRPME